MLSARPPFLRQLPPPSAHFPALYNAVATWNAMDSAVRTVCARLPRDLPPAERLGLLYRFAGTMTKHARRLRALGLASAACDDALRAYDAAIADEAARAAGAATANPDQIVFEMARAMLTQALQEKEERAMLGQHCGDALRELFVRARELFGLLGEWCDREEDATMVIRCRGTASHAQLSSSSTRSSRASSPRPAGAGFIQVFVLVGSPARRLVRPKPRGRDFPVAETARTDGVHQGLSRRPADCPDRRVTRRTSRASGCGTGSSGRWSRRRRFVFAAHLRS